MNTKTLRQGNEQQGNKSSFLCPSFLCLLPALLLLCGCGTLRIAPGADPVIVNAEHAAESALDAFDAFLQWERANETAAGPEVHRVADDIRENGLHWINDLRAATEAYRLAKSGDTLDKLKFAQSLLELALTEVRQHYHP